MAVEYPAVGRPPSADMIKCHVDKLRSVFNQHIWLMKTRICHCQSSNPFDITNKVNMEVADRSPEEGQSFNSTTFVDIVGPPQRIAEDNIRLGLMILLFLAGTPLNVTAMLRLRRSMLTSSTPLKRLKLHLNVSDLMVLLIYTSSQIVWLITVDWRSNDSMCKLLKFTHALCFSVSSNVIVCIAIHRFSMVFGKSKKRVTTINLCLAWTLAVATSLPQLAVWTVYRPSESAKWQQCVSIWFAREYDLRTRNRTTLTEPLVSSTAYSIYHVLIIFWIPAALLTMCYLRLAMVVSKGIYCECGCVRSSQKSPLTADITLSGDSNLHAISSRRLFSRIRSFSSSSSRGFEKAMMRHQCITMRRKRNAIRTCFLLITAYICCWLPYNTFFLWGLIDNDSYQQWHNTSVAFLRYLIVVNSVTNPFIYLPNFRSAFCSSHVVQAS
uniref:G_PROTEIN_RECEP_F1_2 domain-containing protein n=1 Tax=Trichuris muris TaxID=70415 RepID=A0A5S6QXW4_TRIMR